MDFVVRPPYFRGSKKGGKNWKERICLKCWQLFLFEFNGWTKTQNQIKHFYLERLHSRTNNKGKEKCFWFEDFRFKQFISNREQGLLMIKIYCNVEERRCDKRLQKFVFLMITIIYCRTDGYIYLDYNFYWTYI